ncbi:hypothetical protein NXW24_20820 [Bacteroides fragilis]|nr:hypothetical protein [Bacteroides fragilis]
MIPTAIVVRLHLASFSMVPVTFVAKQSNGGWGTVNGGQTASKPIFITGNPLRALSKKRLE